jgi:mandelonitrile lyase
MLANASEFPLEDYYNYIIVGSGTTGCPLATTQSQIHHVFEHGRLSHEKTNLINQGGFLNTLLNANNQESPTQSFVSEYSIVNTSGCVLGSSSTINTGFYSRANHKLFTGSGLLGT